jgi:hypothetical protein
VPSSTIDVLSRHLEHVALTDPASDLPTLAEVLDAVPDPRHRRGRRYRLGPLLALSLLAVLSGATSLTKITRFIAGYDPDLRTQLGLPATTRLAASALGRLLARLDGDAFDTATCAYLAAITTGHPPETTTQTITAARTSLLGLAVDGKTLRGSRTGDSVTHLLAAVRHDTQASGTSSPPAATSCSSSRPTSPRSTAGSRRCPGAKRSSTTAPTSAGTAAARSAA